MNVQDYSKQILEPLDSQKGRRDASLQERLVERFGQEKFSPGFERLFPYFADFKTSLEEKGTKIITIAGTNGKGQTAFQTYGHCRSEGLNVALWTSPHIMSVRERFLFNDEYISVEELEKLVNQALESSLRLSYYEALFWIFHQWIQKKTKNLDVLIFEVGLGGRLDAVNLFDAHVAAIVSVGRDHQEVLGTRLKTILGEKMGVRRQGRWLLSTLSSNYLRSELFKLHGQKRSFDLYEAGVVTKETPYHQSNALLAFFLSRCAMGENPYSLDLQEREKVLLNPPWEGPGRGQEMTSHNSRFTFIGAHNLDGFRQMVKRFAAKQETVSAREKTLFSGEIIVSFSDRSESEIEHCLEILAMAPCLASKLTLTCFDHPRAASEEKLERVRKSLVGGTSCGHMEIAFDPNWKEIDHNLSSSTSQSYLVVGSYYFLSTFQQFLLSR